MKLEYFQYLKAIHQAKSISLASNRLFISQQALSKSIKAFEDEIGATLFLRTNQGITLTQEGEEVLQIGNQILALVQELSHRFDSNKNKQIKGSLNIILTSSIQDQFFAKCISNFYRFYPDISLSIRLGDEIEILQSLLEGTSDLGFLYTTNLDGDSYPTIDEQLTFVPVAKYRYIALVSKKSPLSKLNAISLQQLANYPIIIVPSSELSSMNNYKLMHHFGASTFYPVRSYSILFQLIGDNVGVAIAAGAPLILNGLPTDVVSIPINNNAYNTLGYVYNRNTFNNPCVEPFLHEFLNQ